ncbi:hypothetical protein GH714_013886 [Hevea brasiliensis]|uniref:RPW8 domain-containing protein n=1 Tax=Hevea brasiliensis TaxID=3981 RepID=A0A6A6NGY8_HEVBR|nr:hypothetical protein GH714_013886 [Hevea brasiliensis]
MCKTSADSLITSINELLPIIQEIKYSGVELPAVRQVQLDRLSDNLRDGIELARKVLLSNRWNVYKNLQLARKMEKLEKKISMFVNVPMQAHVLADVHHLRFETAERFDRLEGSARRLEQRLGVMKIGVGSGGWMDEAVKRVEVEEERWDTSLANLLGVAWRWGREGGDGHFQNRILFLTVSQSPNLEQLKAKIWRFVSGSDAVAGGVNGLFNEWNPQLDWRNGTRIATYEVEFLREDEAISLFCLSAFEKKSVPAAADANLVKQIVNECKGLPLALKVIGASLRDQPEMYWASAKKRLSRGEPICESHENKLLDRMAISINFLSKKVRECFLDLGCFPEDKKIPLDVLINIAGDLYSSYYEIFVTQHDVLRDLAIHLANHGILSITNCHNLQEIPANLGNLKVLKILRLYACPTLKMLPSSTCELVSLRYLDISQCINLKCLPEKIGKLSMLVKIDMRECSEIWELPKSVESLESLRIVICDEEISWLWKDLGKNSLHVQVAEKHYDLDWLDE